MMTSTHAFVGAAIGAAVAWATPEVGAMAVLAGFVGGALPDADLLATHRRTTHYPVLAPLVAVPVTAGAVLVGTVAALVVAVAVIAAAVHCLMDVWGGGVEHRPWEATSERAVYDHVSGRWVRPRRWVRWSGAPEDFLLALACAIPALAATRGASRALLLGVLLVSGVFVFVRRRLAGLSSRLLGSLDG